MIVEKWQYILVEQMETTGTGNLLVYKRRRGKREWQSITDWDRWNWWLPKY